MSKSKFDVIAMAKQSGCTFDSRDNAVFTLKALIEFNNLIVSDIRNYFKPNDENFKTITIKKLNNELHFNHTVFVSSD